jgi:hypothetical protein
MQRRSKMLAILTAGTAITAAVGLARHAPPAQASPVSEAPAFGRVVRSLPPGEFSRVFRGGRIGGGALQSESLAPFLRTARQRAEDGINSDLNMPACNVLREIQKPIDSDPMGAAMTHPTWPEDAEEVVEPSTSFSGSDITWLANTYCNARKIRSALNW